MNKDDYNIVPFPLKSGEKADAANHISASPEDSNQATLLALAEQRLLDCLSSGGGETFGLTCEKYGNRGVFRPAEGSSGKYIVSVERHRAVAGCSYHPGSPMSAFETFQQELIFDPELMELDDYDVQHGGYTIDVGSLAQQQLADTDWSPRVLRSKNWKSKRRVELCICNWSIETQSRAKARAALEEELRSLNHEASFESHEMGREEIADYSQRLEDAFTGIILGEFDQNWNDSELIDD